MSQSNRRWQQTTEEILEEYPGEVTPALLSLRATPGVSLRQRVAAIPHEERSGRAFHGGYRGLWRRLTASKFSAGAVALLVVLAVVLAVPRWRTVTAQTLSQAWYNVRFAMTTSPSAIVTFSPAPPFDVYQPARVPEGYELTAQLYRSNGGSLSEEAMHDRPSQGRVEGLVAEYSGAGPYVILLYESEAGDYFLLFQRSVREGEPLPDGEAIEVDDRHAVLRQEGNGQSVSWMTDQTWITLEGTLPERELTLLANRLRRTQEARNEMVAEATAAAPNVQHYPYCDPARATAEAPAQQPATVNEEGVGTVRVIFSDEPGQPDGVAYGISGVDEGHRLSRPEEVLRRAIAALEDPDLVMHSTSPGKVYVLSEEGLCLEPAPGQAEKNYIMVMVREETATVSYRGEDNHRQVERAIKAIREELEQVRQKGER